MGYRIHQSNTFINLSLDDWSRPVRIYFDENKTKSLGAEYTKPAIERRIAQKCSSNSLNKKSVNHYLPQTEEELRCVDILPKVKRARYKGSIKNARGKPARLSVTYYRITYKLCVVSMPGRPHRKRRMSVYMRKEVGKMNKYLDEISLLRRTGICSTIFTQYRQRMSQSLTHTQRPLHRDQMLIRIGKCLS